MRHQRLRIHARLQRRGLHREAAALRRESEEMQSAIAEGTQNRRAVPRTTAPSTASGAAAAGTDSATSTSPRTSTTPPPRQSGIVDAAANAARIRPISYREAAKRACRADVESMKAIFPAIEEGDLGYLCMDLVYEYSLLVDGFGLDPFEEVTVVKNVEGLVDWGSVAAGLRG
ncbi:hypothetical protein SASPL_146413 [Salvia splendens]|uniref:Uncharacterized protein n=1 Tax=Salvia splendens TaxID=180675 RepID=A0A8X8Z4V6_SALSN|nr:hypothetical protein SASPL_146413 [Salvia splendens]